MGRTRGACLSGRQGYTVVEVVIVLAITGVLFISAIAVFGSKQRQTEFNQVMQDLASKIQSIANEVKSGNFEDSSAYGCSGSSGRPVVTLTSGGNNQDCITLGKAMQVTSGSDIIYFYTILGLRNSAQSVKDANPEPIMGDSPPTSTGIDLTEEYSLTGAAEIVWARTASPTDNYEMAGFYLAPAAASSAGQGSTFTAQAYKFTSPSDSYKNSAAAYSAIKDCLRQPTPANDCTNALVLGRWELCVQSADSQRQALLTIDSTSGGITTNISDKECVAT